MSKYGDARFQVSGTLEAVPQLQTSKNGIEFCEFVLVVVERNNQTKEDVTKYIPITAFKYDAKKMCGRYVKAGMFFTVTGTVKAREWKDNNGNDRLTVSLVAGKILGGT